MPGIEVKGKGIPNKIIVKRVPFTRTYLTFIAIKHIFDARIWAKCARQSENIIRRNRIDANRNENINRTDRNGEIRYIVWLRSFKPSRSANSKKSRKLRVIECVAWLFACVVQIGSFSLLSIYNIDKHTTNIHSLNRCTKHMVT